MSSIGPLRGLSLRWQPWSGAMDRVESGVHMSGAKRRKKLLSCPHTFFGSTSTICHFGDRFRDGQYNLVNFLFAVLLLYPRAQPFVKVGARAPSPRVPWSRRQ